jgi:hypothetical protein
MAGTKSSQSALSSTLSCGNGFQIWPLPYLWISELCPSLCHSTRGVNLFKQLKRQSLHKLEGSELEVSRCPINFYSYTSKTKSSESTVYCSLL